METKPRPARVAKPGSILRRELEERGWTQKEFAEIIGRPVQAVNEIIAGKKAITPETAILVADALGTSAELWLNMESAYRLHQLQAGKNTEVARKAALREVAPVSELIKRGWVERGSDVAQLETNLLAFLGVPTLQVTPQVAARLRMSATKSPESPSIIAWLRRAEILATEMTTASFCADSFRAAVPCFRTLSTSPDQVATVTSRFAQLGVRVVMIPHLARTYVDGAAFWLDGQSPVIALSLRYNRIDNFWFTLMHEVSHLVLHSDGNEKSFIDEHLERQSASSTEDEANRQARDWLIAQHEFVSLKSESRGRYSRDAILGFASKLRVNPGIVVGRLHYEGLLGYGSLRDLLTPVRIG